MNIELRFLQKAIADKNYISFSYENKSYKNIKPLNLDANQKLHSDQGIVDFGNIKKLVVLREKF